MGMSLSKLGTSKVKLPTYFVLNSSPWLVIFSAVNLKSKLLRFISSVTLFRHFLSSYFSIFAKGEWAL